MTSAAGRRVGESRDDTYSPSTAFASSYRSRIEPFFFAINLPGDLFSRNSILKGKKRHSARSWTRREMRLAPSCCSSPCHLANRTFLSCSQLPLSAFCGGKREALRGISLLFLHFDAANVRGSEGDREIRNQATSAETRLASPVGRKGTFD